VALKWQISQAVRVEVAQGVSARPRLLGVQIGRQAHFRSGDRLGHLLDLVPELPDYNRPLGHRMLAMGDTGDPVGGNQSSILGQQSIGEVLALELG